MKSIMYILTFLAGAGIVFLLRTGSAFGIVFTTVDKLAIVFSSIFFLLCGIAVST